LYVNVFFFLKYNHAVDEVDIDEGCQKYVDESKFYCFTPKNAILE
jgi:hypothetical protein